MDKLLNQFLAVADAGSITGASAALLVTQPTLTFNMRKLEEQIGVKLLQRSSRGVTLTTYGETLYENARLMRRLHHNMLGAIADQRERSERGISMGSGYSWWTLFLKDMVVDYQRQFPNAPVHVSLGNQLRCMDQLIAGDISLFLAHEFEGLSPHVGVEFLPLTQVRHGFFVRQGHPLLGRPRRVSEIEAYPQATTTPPESRHQRYFDASRRHTRAETVFDRTSYAFASNALEACVDYVQSCDAVLRHSQVMEESFAHQGLVAVEQAEMPRESRMGIYLLAESRHEERIVDLVRRIGEAAAAVLPPLA
ncbi:MAG: LysR family transcriptional regulator [Candidatus Devosia phytovorans]|uniref:LysR family transcriptional regulator n=1 Tax=Candidatus Devosia phytovorans TaxID=3121372 RepID=A0AAJ5VV25_9HYPH|nr:LysR family transcriptional regulator [Devosia sp.]WEK03993.1 MAG: LysR family transcriptional regulator [Devosia sp.]